MSFEPTLLFSGIFLSFLWIQANTDISPAEAVCIIPFMISQVHLVKPLQ